MSASTPSLAERVELLSKWDAGEHASVESSVAYHRLAHAAELDLWSYLRRAAAFDRDKATRNPPTGTRRDGTVKFKHKSGEFLIERDGKILSYGLE